MAGTPTVASQGVRVVLLDGAVGDLSGVVAALRASGIRAPIVVLACPRSLRALRGLLRDTGGISPIDRSSPMYAEMLRGVLSQCLASTGLPHPAPLRWGPIELWRERGELRVNGHRSAVTPLEGRLLSALIEADGDVVSGSVLRRSVHRAAVGRSAVSTRIGALRQKLGVWSRLLVCKRSRGYRLLDPKS